MAIVLFDLLANSQLKFSGFYIYIGMKITRIRLNFAIYLNYNIITV